MHNEPPGDFSRRHENENNDEKPTYKLPPLPLKNTEAGPPIAQGRRPRRRVSPMRLALIIFGIFLFVFGGALSLGYLYYVNAIQKPVSKFIRPVARSTSEPTRSNATPVYDTIKGRSWNILLMGSDNDHKYTFPAVLTQVMMIVHIDPQANTVSMVSIPRDSWVYVPDVGGMHKIDQAFFLGAVRNNSFEGGVQMARATIEKDFGVSIDRYAWVGLDGFAKVIDTLGGVDIDITHPIVDDTYPNDTGSGANPNDPFAFKRLYIAPGPQHLNGEQALEYVRSRHADQLGDIGRTQRQQEVLEALKQKLNLSSIVNKLPELIKDLTGKIYTDLNEQEMLAFANYGRTLSSTAISRVTLGPGPQNYGSNASVYDPAVGANQDVIIPHCDQIQPVLNQLFGNQANCNVAG